MDGRVLELFGGFPTIGARGELLTRSGVVYYEMEVLGAQGIA